MKLREWTGERGVYSKLFDQHTTLKTDADWLFFNVERSELTTRGLKPR